MCHPLALISQGNIQKFRETTRVQTRHTRQDDKLRTHVEYDDKNNDNNEIDNELKYSEVPVSSSSNINNSADDEPPVYRIDKILNGTLEDLIDAAKEINLVA